MKLFFAPEFSSLAEHIALIEADLEFELAEVDLDTKRLADGGNYLDINPRGQVPALLFEDGRLLTENVAILDWIADRAPKLAPPEPFGRYRLLEMLSLIATEIHKRFPIYLSLPDDARQPIADDILRWFTFCSDRLAHGFLLGDAFTVADAYLFVMARGALQMGMPLDDRLRDYISRIDARPAVLAALQREHASHGADNGGGDADPSR
jgi:glutathione S-transferase